MFKLHTGGFQLHSDFWYQPSQLLIVWLQLLRLHCPLHLQTVAPTDQLPQAAYNLHILTLHNPHPTRVGGENPNNFKILPSLSVPTVSPASAPWKVKVVLYLVISLFEEVFVCWLIQYWSGAAHIFIGRKATFFISNHVSCTLSTFSMNMHLPKVYFRIGSIASKVNSKIHKHDHMNTRVQHNTLHLSSTSLLTF